MGFCLDRVKATAQGRFFLALAIIPRAALQRHMQHIVADEMRARACAQHTGIGFIGPHFAQSFGVMDARFGHFRSQGWPEIAKRRYRLRGGVLMMET